MNRKPLAICLVLLLGVLLIAGCAPSQGTPEQPTEQVMKVAMLANGPINDGGWVQSGYEGLLEIQDKYGADIAYSENVAEPDRIDLLRGYAEQGYNLIFGHGFEWGEPLQTVAAEFPDVYFVQIGGYETNGSNLGVYESTEAGELGYMAGAAAALLTKTNKAGLVGAVDIPTITDEFAAFEQALAEYNPEATVVTAFTGSWVDVEGAHEAALAQISSGIDTIWPNGDAANVGVINAAEEAGGVMVVGASRDQSELGPNTVMTSIIYPIDLQMLAAFEAVKDGTFSGEFNMLEGPSVQLAPFHASVPQDVRDQLNEILHKVWNDEVQFTLPEHEW